MLDCSPSLNSTQRWMQAVITDPLGIRAGINSPQAQREISVADDDVEQVVLRSRLCTAKQRLGVYHNAYFIRLLECLREDFPAFAHAVGDEVFAQFALDCVRQFPSRSYTLASLPERFVTFLRESRAGMQTGDDPQTLDWSQFLIDLATLERTRHEVFDGPGAERTERFLSPESLLSIPPSEQASVSFITNPGLRLLELNSPVHEYASALRDNINPSHPKPHPTYLAIYRRQYQVQTVSCSRFGFQLLRRLRMGQRLGVAVSESVAADMDVASLGAEIYWSVRRWTEERILVGLRVHDCGRSMWCVDACETAGSI